MKIEKYRPNFFTGFEEEVYEVNSKEELLSCGLFNPEGLEGFIGLSYHDGVISSNFTNGDHYVVALVRKKEDKEVLENWFNGKSNNKK